MPVKVTCGKEPGAGLVAQLVSVTNGQTSWKEPRAGPVAKWVNISNGSVWRGTWGGVCFQVDKCQQWLHEERRIGVGLAAKLVSVSNVYILRGNLGRAFFARSVNISNGYMYVGDCGGPVCQVVKCQH